MRHLNLAPVQFLETGHRYYSQQLCPPWTYGLSMEWYGHSVNSWFYVEIPRQIVPVVVSSGKDFPVRVMPPDSFNVVTDESRRMRVIPAVQRQEGTLVFGCVDTGSERFDIALGGEHILHSVTNDYYSRHKIVFAALLRSDQRVVIRKKVWVDSRNPKDWGRNDVAYVFSGQGFTELPWAELTRRQVNEAEARQLKDNIASGKWKLY